MKVCSLRLRVCLGTAVSLFCAHAFAQTSSSSSSLNVAYLAPEDTMAVAELPDAPQPQGALQAASQDTAKPAAGTAQSATDQNKSQHDLADEQLKKQKQQRTLGLVPAFNISYVYNAAPLTAKQKFALAFRSEIDPAAFGVAMLVAGIEQAEGTHRGYGGGWGGYAKRYGQSYTDSFDGQMIGNALLPSLLHQDPRYFRLGRGPAKRRILYALGTNVIAHHDGTGRWEPNYSNVLGNLAAGGISNLYLPQEDRGFGSTVTGALVVIAEGGAGSMFQEFWPDIARRFLHKDPTHGQDAINASLPDPTGGRPLFHNPPKHPKTDDQ